MGDHSPTLLSLQQLAVGDKFEIQLYLDVKEITVLSHLILNGFPESTDLQVSHVKDILVLGPVSLQERLEFSHLCLVLSYLEDGNKARYVGF